MESIISFKSVSLKCKNHEGLRQILTDINVEVTRPVLVVSGPSGAGKTSLVRMINGLISPSEGVVSVLGQTTEDWDPRSLRKKVGHMCQQPVALTDCAGSDLQLAADLSGKTYEQGQIVQWYAALGLKESMLNQSAAHYSVGERQRFALIRALTCGPSILVLDEPTSALDDDAAQNVHALIASQVDKGLSLVVIEHRPALLDVYDSEQVHRLELSEGKIFNS